MGVVMEGTWNKGMTECVVMTEVTLVGHFMFVPTYVHTSHSPVCSPADTT